MSVLRPDIEAIQQLAKEMIEHYKHYDTGTHPDAENALALADYALEQEEKRKDLEQTRDYNNVILTQEFGHPVSTGKLLELLSVAKARIAELEAENAKLRELCTPESLKALEELRGIHTEAKQGVISNDTMNMRFRSDQPSGEEQKTLSDSDKEHIRQQSGLVSIEHLAGLFGVDVETVRGVLNERRGR